MFENFCWHKWSQWGPTWTYGFRRYQTKVCMKCQKQVDREAGWSSNDELRQSVDEQYRRLKTKYELNRTRQK